MLRDVLETEEEFRERKSQMKEMECEELWVKGEEKPLTMENQPAMDQGHYTDGPWSALSLNAFWVLGQGTHRPLEYAPLRVRGGST